MSQKAKKRSLKKIGPLQGSQVGRLRKGALQGLKRLGFPTTDENIKLLRDVHEEVMGRILRGENPPEEIHDLIRSEMKKRTSQSTLGTEKEEAS